MGEKSLTWLTAYMAIEDKPYEGVTGIPYMIVYPSRSLDSSLHCRESSATDVHLHRAATPHESMVFGCPMEVDTNFATVSCTS